jgi:putative DNA primase/helicase
MKPLREFSPDELRALGDEQLLSQVSVEAAAHLNGGPDFENYHHSISRSPEMRVMFKRTWKRVKDQIAARPKPEEITLVPQIDAGLQVSGKPSWVRIGRAKVIEAKANEPSISKAVIEGLREVQILPVQGRALAVPMGFAPMSIGELTLNPATPFDSAQKLITLRAWQPDEGIRTWRHWQKSFWQWTGQCWKEMEDETVRAFLWFQLNDADKIVKGGKSERFEPKPEHVNALTDALKAATNVPTKGNPMPGWIGEARDDDYVRECVALQNGILHLPTREPITHTPRFWSPNVLDFSYDPSARAPRFEQFLEELWPGDEEAQQCLLEVLGLCFTDITKYQKAFMFVGPKRGGRGTIGRLLKGLIGAENYIGTSLKAFSEPFGMESLIGKKVAVFSDARLDGVPQRNLSAIVERLLLITGQDDIDVNRKNSKYWHGALTARCIIFSNELLKFPDASGALPGRFIISRMTQNFYGREDVNLTDKLLAERPGIFNLALNAFDQLRERGRLIQPTSGLEMSESLGELSSDVSVFIEERCDVGQYYKIVAEDLFKVWEGWCLSRNIRHAWGLNQFTEKLRAALPTLRTSRPRKNNPRRLTTLFGIAKRVKEKK